MPRANEGVIRNNIKTKNSRKRTEKAKKWCKLEHL